MHACLGSTYSHTFYWLDQEQRRSVMGAYRSWGYRGYLGTPRMLEGACRMWECVIWRLGEERGCISGNCTTSPSPHTPPLPPPMLYHSHQNTSIYIYIGCTSLPRHWARDLFGTQYRMHWNIRGMKLVDRGFSQFWWFLFSQIPPFIPQKIWVHTVVWILIVFSLCSHANQ